MYHNPKCKQLHLLFNIAWALAVHFLCYQYFYGFVDFCLMFAFSFEARQYDTVYLINQLSYEILTVFWCQKFNTIGWKSFSFIDFEFEYSKFSKNIPSRFIFFSRFCEIITKKKSSILTASISILHHIRKRMTELTMNKNAILLH